MLALVLVLVFQGPVLAGSGGCVVRWPFQSSSVTIQLEEAVPVRGCQSRQVTATSSEVHVLSLESAGPRASGEFLPRVALRVEAGLHPGPVVLVLHAVEPVMWHLEATEDLIVTAVVCSKSHAIYTGQLEAIHHKRSLHTLTQILNWLEGAFGALSSLTYVSLANKIVFRAGHVEEATTRCNTSAQMPVSHVQVTYVQPQPVSGCQDCDAEKLVYGIEIESSENSTEIDVYLQTLNHQGLPHIDLFLVLKSHNPENMTWNIKANGIQGTVLILTEGNVNGENLTSYLNMHVQKMILANTTAQLVTQIEKTLGSMFSFTHSQKGNQVNILIGKIRSEYCRFKNPISHIIANKEPLVQKDIIHINPSTMSPKERFRTQINRLPGMLAGEMLPSGRNVEDDKGLGVFHQCNADKITLSIPIEKVIQQFGQGIRITLADSNCELNFNDSHYVLEFGLHTCNTSPMIRDSSRIYYNKVQFWQKNVNDVQDDEDFISEQGSGIPLEEHPLMTIQIECLYNLSNVINPISEDIKMTAYLDKNFSQPIYKFPAQLSVHDHLYLEAAVIPGTNHCISLEDCWLTSVQNPSKHTLLLNGCPKDLSVTVMQSESKNLCLTQRRFSFQISEDFVYQDVHLHCHLSPCSPSSSGPGYRKCIPYEQYCGNHSIKPFLDANKRSKLQIIGPLHVVPKSQKAYHQQVIMMGLSATTVVVIALVSFLLGAGLMAALWFIHLKTGKSPPNPKP